MAKQFRGSLTLIGVFLLAFALAGFGIWRTDVHTAWAGGSYPTVEMDGELFYIVRSGNTVSELAEAFGVSEEELRAVNDLEPDAELRTGQRLRIPESSDVDTAPAFAELMPVQTAPAGEAAPAMGIARPPAAVGEDGLYTVVRGDTLRRIEVVTGVPAADIVRYNNLQPGKPFYRGQRLRLAPAEPNGNQADNNSAENNSSAAQTAPDSPTATSQTETYTIQRGDSLQRIARLFGVSVDDIVATNDLNPRTPFYPGQVLQIPVRGNEASVHDNDGNGENNAEEGNSEEGNSDENDSGASDSAPSGAKGAEPGDDVEDDTNGNAPNGDDDEDMNDEDANGSDVNDEEANDEEANGDNDEAIDEIAENGTEENGAEENGAEENGAEENGDASEQGMKGEEIEDATPEDAVEEDVDDMNGEENGEEAIEEDAADEEMGDEAGMEPWGAHELWQEFATADEARIHVFSPAPDNAYHSQLEIIGLSQTFEGNVEMQLIGENDEILAERFATGGSIDGYDFFRTHLRFTVQEPISATLVVFERSMKDGSMLEEVEIPVSLLPGQRFIDIYQPEVGASLCNTVLVAGYSNTFEANVSLELAAPDGDVLTTDFTMGGAYGIYREFFHVFDYTAEEAMPVLITAYEEDASDRFGRIDPITVPVTYLPGDDPACEF